MSYRDAQNHVGSLIPQGAFTATHAAESVASPRAPGLSSCSPPARACRTLAISCEGRTTAPWSLVAATPWRLAPTMLRPATTPPLVSFIALFCGAVLANVVLELHRAMEDADDMHLVARHEPVHDAVVPPQQDAKLAT